MVDHLDVLWKACLACWVLGLVGLVVMFFSPGTYSTFMMLSMLFFVLATLTTVSSMLRGFYDLITAKNDGQWKIIWGIIIFVFSIIGLTAYMLKGRKERIS